MRSRIPLLMRCGFLTLFISSLFSCNPCADNPIPLPTFFELTIVNSQGVPLEFDTTQAGVLLLFNDQEEQSIPIYKNGDRQLALIDFVELTSEAYYSFQLANGDIDTIKVRWTSRPGDCGQIYNFCEFHYNLAAFNEVELGGILEIVKD